MRSLPEFRTDVIAENSLAEASAMIERLNEIDADPALRASIAAG